MLTPFRLRRNQKKTVRRLEIGPGDRRLPGFESLNIVGGRHIDYVLDASKALPFKDDSFDLIYASHILEHIAWYRAEEVLREWVRVVKHGGKLELWVPDGLKICKALVDFELYGDDRTHLDGFNRFNAHEDPCRWASARIYTYGDGTGRSQHWNWHRALFTARYVGRLLERVGLVDILALAPENVRGDSHGWINLGVGGTKP